MSEKKKTPRDTSDEKYPEIKPYPASEDIYNNAGEEQDIDPEDLTKTKEPNEKPGKRNEKSFEDDMTAEDLDIPGDEEDENNYYSLGGDKEK